MCSKLKRIKKNSLKEVIIATSATVEGQTTAHYIEDTIKNDKIKITKLRYMKICLMAQNILLW